MGWLRGAGLLVTGLAVGYLARRQSEGSPVGRDLQRRESGNVPTTFFASEGTMAQFFDSKYGKPFQSAALRTVKFVSDVRAGMNEKEAEIQQKLERQKRDLRPGSLDTWAESRPLEDPAVEALEGQALDADTSLRQERLARDRALGDDFFAG